MTILTLPVPRTALYFLSLAHGLHDLYTGIWSVVLTFQKDRLDLSYTQIGIATAMYIIVSALVQPPLGDFFDRTGKPYLALWAVAGTTLMIALAALAPNFLVLNVLAVGAGVGSAAFHSAGLSSSQDLSAGRGRGRSTAIFLVGGNAGFALGAPFGGAMLEHYHASTLLLPAFLIMLSAPLLILNLRPYLSNLVNQPTMTGRHLLSAGRTVWLAVIAFVLIQLARESMRAGYSTYLPQYYKAEGGDLEYAGRVTGLFLFFVAMGSLVGGMLSDRLPRRTLAVVTLAMVAPLSFVMLRSDGLMLGITSILLGLAINMSLPIMLNIGQEVLPGGSSGASGYAFGITFLAGGIANLVIGAISDEVGLLNTLTAVGILPSLALAFFWLLPERPLVLESDSRISHIMGIQTK